MKNLSIIFLSVILLCLIGIAVTQQVTPAKNEVVSEYVAISTSSPNVNIATTEVEKSATDKMVSTNHTIPLSSQSPNKTSSQQDPTYLNFLYGIIFFGFCTTIVLLFYLKRIWIDLYLDNEESTLISETIEETKDYLAHV